MIGLLTTLVEAFEDVGTYVLYAIETGINAVFGALEAALVAANEALPSLPSTVEPPTILGWLNWFYPVGAVLAVATTLVSAYGVFLGVRWTFKQVGVL